VCCNEGNTYTGRIRRRGAYLGQLQQNARRLDELTAQDAQVGLRGEVQAVVHRGRRGQLLIGHQRVVDGQVHLGVHLVTDEDAIVVVVGGGGGGGGGSGRVGRRGDGIRGHCVAEM